MLICMATVAVTRGFAQNTNDTGCRKVARYTKENADIEHFIR